MPNPDPEPEKVVRLTRWSVRLRVPSARRKRGDTTPAQQEEPGPATLYGVDADGTERVYATFPNSAAMWEWVKTDPLASAARAATTTQVHVTLAERDPYYKVLMLHAPPADDPAYGAWRTLVDQYWDRLSGSHAPPKVPPEAIGPAFESFRDYLQRQMPPPPPPAKPEPTPEDLRRRPRYRPGSKRPRG